MTLEVISRSLIALKFFSLIVLAVVSLCTLTTITGINKTIGGYVAKGFHGTVKETTKLSLKTGSLGRNLNITKEGGKISPVNFEINSTKFFVGYQNPSIDERPMMLAELSQNRESFVVTRVNGFSRSGFFIISSLPIFSW